MNVGAGTAQEHRRLPGGVAAAHDGDRVSTAGLGLHLGGRVVDADALELGQPVQGQPVVARPGGDDDRLRGDRVTIVEPDPVQAGLRRQRHRPGSLLDPDAELLGLQRRPRRQLLPGQARGETEQVLDPRRGSRLAAQRGVLGQDRRHPLGRAVHGGRQSAGTGAHHQQIAHAGQIGVARPGQAQRVEQLTAAGVPQQRAARHHDDRQVRDGHVELAEHRLGVG